MCRKKGFTLIELMIVVAIIAIIAAIAIPNLISSKISAHEASAISGLKMLVSVEATWLQQDPDGSGKDYWTYDVSTFYRIRQANPFIPISFAKADAAFGADDFLGVNPVLYDFTGNSITTTNKSGYLFQAMDLNVSGTAYNQALVGADQVAAANTSEFAFMAAPNVWNTSGVRCFIINTSGSVFACNPGSGGATKWKTTATYGLRWPSANPDGVAGPGGVGMNWTIAE